MQKENLEFRKPPKIDVNLRNTHIFRFTTTATCSVEAVTVADLCGVCGVMNLAAGTSNRAVAAAVRLKWIKIWSPAISTGAYISGSCSLQWAGQNYNPSMEKNDSTNSLSDPAYVHTSPPRGSDPGNWYLNSVSATLFFISCTAGSVVDVCIEFIQNDSLTVLTVTSGASGSTGVIYYRALDASTTGNLAPVGLRTLV